MKTAVSIPDSVFMDAEVTDAMDRVCAELDGARDEFVFLAAGRTLVRTEW
jgi:hypothetical protein